MGGALITVVSSPKNKTAVVAADPEVVVQGSQSSWYQGPSSKGQGTLSKWQGGQLGLIKTRTRELGGGKCVGEDSKKTTYPRR